MPTVWWVRKDIVMGDGPNKQQGDDEPPIDQQQQQSAAAVIKKDSRTSQGNQTRREGPRLADLDSVFPQLM
jgi:hypothetical protein